MTLPQHREPFLLASRKYDFEFIEVTEDQRWNRLRVHIVDFNRYGLKPNGREKMQNEIEAEPDNIKLA